MALAFDVHIRNKDLASFRRRVLYHYRKKPGHEYMEVIFVRRGVGEYHVVSFHKIRMTKTSPYVVEYDDLQYQALKNQARSEGLSLGSIHTHTVSDSSPSRHDVTSGVEEGDSLIGICEVSDDKGKLSTKLDFWIPMLPCLINQVKD
jgi:proteasome lid subunit RPN8/RPN11